MEIEIELNVALTPDLALQVQEALAGKFDLVSFKTTPGRFSVRPVESVNANLAIDGAIRHYLESVASVGVILAQVGGVLRVGAFFSSEEAAAFEVELSNTTVQMLAQYQLAVDVTCYPCSG